MQYTRLGSSGLRISRIALGIMSFGDGKVGRAGWPIGYDDAAPFFRQALDLGITFWDTANGYNSGTSEEAVGRALKQFTRRDDIVLATKVFFPVHDGPGGSGLSRKAIMEQIDASLTRLGTDYIDVYQIHRFDPQTPVEETMQALHDVVKAGKARYLGASSMLAWRFAKLQHAAAANGWTKFVSMQDQYNLIHRGKSWRCSDYSPTRASAASRGARSRRASSPGRGPTATPTAVRAAWTVSDAPSGSRPIRHHRRHRANRRPARGVDGPGRAGMGAEESRGRRADRRRHQTTPPG